MRMMMWCFTFIYIEHKPFHVQSRSCPVVRMGILCVQHALERDVQRMPGYGGDGYDVAFALKSLTWEVEKTTIGMWTGRCENVGIVGRACGEHGRYKRYNDVRG